MKIHETKQNVNKFFIPQICDECNVTNPNTNCIALDNDIGYIKLCDNCLEELSEKVIDYLQKKKREGVSGGVE